MVAQGEDTEVPVFAPEKENHTCMAIGTTVVTDWPEPVRRTTARHLAAAPPLGARSAVGRSDDVSMMRWSAEVTDALGRNYYENALGNLTKEKGLTQRV